MAALLADPRLPEHLRSALFQPAVRSWARAQAMEEFAFDWAAGKPDPDEMFELKPGVMRSPSEIWKGMDGHAARARARLGMDPVSYARIAKDLGLAERAVRAGLEEMAAEGGRIMERRGITGTAVRAVEGQGSQ